jgi:hypothetical protein
MTPQERELLNALFDRLRKLEHNEREPEAERFIAEAVAAQPSAPYFMAQLLLVQDQALSAAQARIRQLEQAAGAARQQAASPGRSFLPGAGVAGPWGPHTGTTSAQPPTAAPPAQPITSGAVPGGGGFLRGALQTAAGVAGGALLFEGINSLFHHVGAPWGGGGGFLPTAGAPTLIEENIINEYGGESGPGSVENAAFADDATQLPPSSEGSDASFLTPASDDGTAATDDWSDQDDSDVV